MVSLCLNFGKDGLLSTKMKMMTLNTTYTGSTSLKIPRNKSFKGIMLTHSTTAMMNKL